MELWLFGVVVHSGEHVACPRDGLYLPATQYVVHGGSMIKECRDSRVTTAVCSLLTVCCRLTKRSGQLLLRCVWLVSRDSRRFYCATSVCLSVYLLHSYIVWSIQLKISSHFFSVWYPHHSKCLYTISRGIPSAGSLNMDEVGKKSLFFCQYLAISWKRYKTGPHLLWNLKGSLRSASNRSASVRWPWVTLKAFLAHLRMYAVTVWPTTIKFGIATHVGEGLRL